MIVFKIKKLMDERALSVNKLSNETGINRASLTSLINNSSKMVQINTLETLAEFFNVSVHDLFDDIDSFMLIKSTFIGFKDDKLLGFFEIKTDFNEYKFNFSLTLSHLVTNFFLINLTVENQSVSHLLANKLPIKSKLSLYDELISAYFTYYQINEQNINLFHESNYINFILSTVEGTNEDFYIAELAKFDLDLMMMPNISEDISETENDKTVLLDYVYLD